MNEQFDDLMIQRLVDGRLELADVQQIIRSADRVPDRWRQIATAFMEESLWHQSLNLPCEVAQGLSGTKPLSVESGTGLATVGIEQDFHPRQMKYGLSSWLAAAALMLLLSGSFWAGRSFMGPSVSPNLQASVDSSLTRPNLDPTHSIARSDNDRSSDPVIRPAQYSPPEISAPYSVRLLGEDSEMAIPVMYETTAREIGYQPKTSEIPEPIQAELRKSGVQLRARLIFLKGAIDNGREIEIPVESMQLVNFGQ